MDYQRLVDDLRAVLHSGDQTLNDRLVELVNQYNDACKAVNERLRRCEEFLKRGLRAEAIHLAQTEPVLLDVLAILDFPERPQWEELLSLYQLPLPPRPMMSTAEALNQAYADADPMEPLLRKHRVLALSYAPLAERLGVMRQIRSRDLANSFWEEDIRSYEQVRVQQLGQEIATARNQQNVAALRKLAQEVRQPDWLEVPSPTLAREIDKAIAQCEQNRARQELRTVEGELNLALSALDVPRGRQLRERWQLLVQQANLPANDPMHRRVEPVLMWLAEQDRKEAADAAYQSDLAALEQGLAGTLTTSQLQQLARQALRHGRGLPPAVDGLCKERVARLQAAGRRQRMMFIGAAVVAFVMIGCGVALWQYTSYRNQRLEAATHLLAGHLQKRDLTAARQYLDYLDEKEPGLVADAAIRELRHQLQEAEEKERARLRDYQASLDHVRSAPLADTEHPELAAARTLARTEAELAEVEQLARDRKDRFEEQQRDRDRTFQQQLDELRGRLQILEKQTAGMLESPATDSTLQDLRTRLDKLDKDAEVVKPELRPQLRTMRERLAGVSERARIARRESEELKQVIAATPTRGEAADYVRALQTYVTQIPQTPRSRDFDKVIESRPSWEAALRWQQFLAARTDMPLVAANAVARTAGMECRKLLEGQLPAEDRKLAELYAAYLQAVGDHQDGRLEDSAATTLRRLLSDIVIKDIWWIRTNDGKIYYLKQDPGPVIKKANLTAQLECLVKFDGTSRKIPIPLPRIEEYGPAPQVEFSNETVHPPGTTWEESILALAEKVRRNDKMDTLLQYVLLKQVLTHGAAGSPFLAEALAPILQKLSEARVDTNVSWLDPDNRDAAPVRRTARDAVAEVPPLPPLAKAALARQQEFLSQLLASRRRVVGWLCRDGDAWLCRMPQPLPGEQELCVLAPVPGQPEVTYWKPIGRSANGKMQLTANMDAIEGQLVFVRLDGR